MTSTLTRGPLPARVYWRRRIVALGIALLLVVGLARLLGAGSDGSDGGSEGSAQLADAPASTSQAPVVGPTAGPTGGASARPGGKQGKPGKGRRTPKPPLASPTGTCEDSDIAVTPDVRRAVAGPDHGAVIVLELRTVLAEACTWRVSPRSLTLKITSGSDDIWTSSECPRAIPVADVTVRRAVATLVEVRWNARRSDEDCSSRAAWAMPGWYHVAAAALAGEPADVQFELEAPQPRTITASPEPEEEEKRGKKGKGKRKDRGPGGSTPTDEPMGGEPSGAVEPDSTEQDEG